MKIAQGVGLGDLCIFRITLDYDLQFLSNTKVARGIRGAYQKWRQFKLVEIVLTMRTIKSPRSRYCKLILLKFGKYQLI